LSTLLLLVVAELRLVVEQVRVDSVLVLALL
jgi:hypothetical protein